MTSWIRAAAPVLVGLLLFAGCGGSDDEPARTTGTMTDSATNPADTPAEAAARRTIVDFYAAMERRDGKRACAALTNENRRELRTVNVPKGSPLRSCEEVIVDEFGGFPAPRITRVRAEGNTASVTVVAPAAEGGGGTSELVKRGNEWKVDAY